MDTTSNKIRSVLTIALAICMAFVYPVHVVIDHSGLFGHHNHVHHDHHDHSRDYPNTDDELCALCLSLGSIEISEKVQLIHVAFDEPYYQSTIFTECKNSRNLSSARAPPDVLLILA
ncbi:MAG: hypothetical protein EA391_01510 [Balneolaceae bacterium]|nr:MAG: hypothetical protein EA391_01510 [Balneolaceae bacterium]